MVLFLEIGDNVLLIPIDPKLSFQEHRTAEIIAKRLHAVNLDVRTGIAGTGVVGILFGDKPGRTIAWRSDKEHRFLRPVPQSAMMLTI